MKIVYISVPPQINPFELSDAALNAGESIQVVCAIKDGDLPISFEWLLNDKSIDTDVEISIMPVGKRGSILSFDAVSHVHAGTYTCVARNQAGEATYSAVLNVNGY